jgi:hypothetical protein
VVVPHPGTWALLLVQEGRQILHAPGFARPPANLPADIEADALAIGGGLVLVGGWREGAEGDPHAVLALHDGQAWVRLPVPHGAGAIDDLAMGPAASAWVAVGRATLAGDGGYALAARAPAAGLQVRLAPVPLVETTPAGSQYLARGNDGSLWRGEFPPP